MTLFSSRRSAPEFHPSEDFPSNKAAVKLDGVKARALETGRGRLLVASLVFIAKRFGASNLK